ncbi:MAG TPA: hypothetical protein VHE54_14775 [Puia sp.]|nr:hypothetical protein [Puia sp.]
MKLLIGVIPPNEERAERLFVLEEGKAVLLKNVDDARVYPNYALLRDRPARINDRPVSGSGVFDFRYGPVTAGIREAGCFHLYTYGEKILRAGIDLSWKARGIEAAMLARTPDAALRLAETVCSNFAFSHSVAFSRAAESALGLVPDLAARKWRILLLEAERVTNHLYQLSRLSAAAAQKVLAAHLSALFEDALRLNACLGGSRYLMGINRLGAWERYPSAADSHTAIEGYILIARKFRQLYEHSLANYNYLDRLHAAGVLTPRQVEDFGLTGPTLRACGLDDQLNSGTEHLVNLPVITHNEGDALARMEIRAEELVNSCQYLADHLTTANTWRQGSGAEQQQPATEGEGCGVAHSPSGAVGYYLNIRDGLIREAAIFTPSYAGMHAVSTALEDLIFTDFPFVFDSFGVHFADAAR